MSHPPTTIGRVQATAFWDEARLERAALASFTMRQESDLPDPLRLQDFKRRRPILADLARRRITEDRYFGRPRVFGFPKRCGDRRMMTQLDPVDELIYHALVGRLIGALEAALGPEVRANRSEDPPDQWVRRPWRREHSRYRDMLDAARHSGRFEGFGRIDTKAHYSTIQLDMLASTLRSVGCAELAVLDLLEALGRLHEVPGHPKGLPIGPDASGPLGTIALLPVDRAVAALAAWWVRWVDDYTIGLVTIDEFVGIRDAAQVQHAVIGQQINARKSVTEKFGTSADSTDPDINDEIVESLGMPADREDAAQGAHSDRLRGLAEAGDFDRMSFCLGALGRDRDAAGVAVLKEHPLIFQRLPKETASYLSKLDGRGVDRDWLEGLVLAPPSLDTAASQLWALTVFTEIGIPASVGTALFDIAVQLPRRFYAPLVNHQLAAAGQSDEPVGRRRTRALEYVESLDDLNGERAGLAAFAGESPNRSSRKGLDHLARCKPELRATVLWAAA